MVPWIDAAFDLTNARVLEIGCGSGSASLAVAQRCHSVPAFDIDRPSLDLAKQRAAYLGVQNITFAELPDTWATLENIGTFRERLHGANDLVLLAAVLEHLLHEERIPVLRALWGVLRPGGIMVIYDTPNRLHRFDSHTFFLPFAHWLPDDLMLAYMHRSSRKDLTEPISRAEHRNHSWVVSAVALATMSLSSPSVSTTWQYAMMDTVDS
jgi:S-adenosylmethionine-dependent methyltransferase